MRFDFPINAHKTLGLDATVYFIQSGEFVKIGWASDLEARIHTLQLGNPVRLRLAARRTVPRGLARQCEIYVHALFDEHAIGREWFRLDGALAARAAQPVFVAAKRAAQGWTDNGVAWGSGRGLNSEIVKRLMQTDRCEG